MIPNLLDPLTERATPDSGAVFVFPGQGAEWFGPGHDWLPESSPFADVIARCDRAVQELAGWSVADVLRGDEGAPESVDVLQPALFAVMVGLAEQWRSCGITPGAVVGHSQGEVAAAVTAGALTIEEGCRIVVGQSRALGLIEGLGAMASLSLSAPAAEELLAVWPGEAALAAVDGPTATVVSGTPEAVEGMLAWCRDNAVDGVSINVDYASHWAQVDCVRDDVLEAVGPASATTSVVPFYSTVAGRRFDTAQLDGPYWFDNLRRTVLLEPVIRQLATEGFTAFVEISPRPVVAPSLKQTLEAAGAAAVVVGPSVPRDPEEPFSLSAESARLATGVDVAHSGA